MALSLLSGLAASPSADPPLTIKSTDGTFAPKLKVSKVTIKMTSTAMRHMKEDGATVVDSRIVQPIVITIDGFCPDKATLSSINDMVTNRTRAYSIVSRGISLTNMIAESEQIQYSGEFTSTVPVRISFKQMLKRKGIKKVTAQQADSSVIDRGMSLLSSVSQTASSLASKVKGIF